MQTFFEYISSLHMDEGLWDMAKKTFNRQSAPVANAPANDPYGLNQPWSGSDWSGSTSYNDPYHDDEYYSYKAPTPKKAQPDQMTTQARAQKTYSRPGYHLHPDHLYGNGKNTLPFIYTSNGQMYIGANGQHHGEMVKSQPEIQKIYGLGQDDERSGWSRMSSDSLMGRLANLDGEHANSQRDTLSYWPSPNTDKLLIPSIQALQQKGLIDSNTQVHIPSKEDATVNDLLNNNVQARNDPELNRRIELAKKLHLLPSDQKRAAMKELGLGSSGKTNQWVGAMRQAGLPAGSSHYFGTSENHQAKPYSFHNFLFLKNGLKNESF